MIVADDTVSDALKYLAQDPHPIAVARHAVTVAENARKGLFASLFRGSNLSTVKDRETAAECDDRFKEAQNKESDALMELERHRARCRAAEMIIEVWRSENANARAAERVR